jgi:hypothetical protein
MIARLAGVMIDARIAARTNDPVRLGRAARWIAGNVLAVRGVRVLLVDPAPTGAHVFEVRPGDVLGVLSALAVIPALVDVTSLARGCRVALRALGLPVVDRPVAEVLAAGASIVTAGPAPEMLRVDGFRVRIVA